jgi:hypothetical protein
MDSVAPFTNTGVDLFGPLKLHHDTKGKRYGLIFACANTRAIHLELLLDMTAETVFRAMRRFVAQYGLPHLIYSDNGTQLIKIKGELEAFISKIRSASIATELMFIWQLQTVSSPWRAGFYERMNRTIKKALSSQTFARKSIDDEELRAIIAEVAALINSRPLFSLDGVVVSPATFLTNKSLVRLPPLGNNDIRTVGPQESLIKDYLKSQKHTRALWSAWRDNYLKELRLFHENPNVNGAYEFRVGDRVIIKSSTLPDTWPIGTIEEIITSADGTARSFRVKSVSRGHEESKVRSIQTLIPLECAREAQRFQNSNPAIPNKQTPQRTSGIVPRT